MRLWQWKIRDQYMGFVSAEGVVRTPRSLWRSFRFIHTCVVPKSEFPIVSSYPHVCTAMVGISHRCEDPRPHAWSMCAACFWSCISLSCATPLGRSRYQTSEFPIELPTHTPAHAYSQVYAWGHGRLGRLGTGTMQVMQFMVHDF